MIFQLIRTLLHQWSFIGQAKSKQAVNVEMLNGIHNMKPWDEVVVVKERNELIQIKFIIWTGNKLTQLGARGRHGTLTLN